MLIEINKVVVKERIRKDFGNITELADDIKENGLINPPVVTPNHELIAGERRLRACKLLGYQQVEVRVMTVKDYEHQLKLEISENENRKEFSFSERVEWAKRLEQVERLKSKSRQESGNNQHRVAQDFAEGSKGESAEKVADVAGFGNKETYRQAKYISDNADEEMVKALDEGKLSINAAYQALKNDLKNKDKELSEKDSKILDLEKAVNDLKVDKPNSNDNIPDDYLEIKSSLSRQELQIKTLKESATLARHEANEAKNEANGYKHYIETFRGGTKSFEAVNLIDFKYAVRDFLRKVSPLIYLGEQFALMNDEDKNSFLEEVETVERWMVDFQQAVEGNVGGANMIILEGGSDNG